MTETTYADVLTRRFYEWEYRGRGWHVSDEPVDIEPPFYPFPGHYIPPPPFPDDSRRPTLVSKLIDHFRKKEVQTEIDEWDVPPLEPQACRKEDKYRAFGISMPKDAKTNLEDMKHFLLMLSDTQYPVSFEIVANANFIWPQFFCRKTDADSLQAQLEAYYPDLHVVDISAELPNQLPDSAAYVVDFGLAEEFMFPLRMPGRSDIDPFVGLFAAMGQLDHSEVCMLQVVFKGANHPWADSIIRATSDNEGGPFFSNAPEILKQAHEKVSSPLFAVCVRMAGFAASEERALQIVRDASSSLERVTASRHNKLVPLAGGERTVESYFRDLYMRQTHRLGMLLNINELSTIVHMPTEGVTNPKLVRDIRKTKAMPEIAYGNEFGLGVNVHEGHGEVATVSPSLRLRHTHIIGATGTGKSTLLITMIAQDMEQGNGCAVLDPHGDLIESILQYVPGDRIQDVILIDPADGDFPIAFNILNAHSDIEKEILASDLVAAFRRLSLSWGDQMNSVFANAILAFLESTEGGTLIDLRRFLVEKGYRDQFLKTVQDPNVLYYWQKEYPMLKSGSVGSILTRLDAFLRPKVIRNMVAQRKGLDFEQIMDSKKILLVKLSQGLIGAENSYLLGTFFVSKIYQAAMARQAKAKAQRSDYFLYIDEFQNFITPSMSHILSGARKYHLGLILAHQDMTQLQKHDSELASSVVVNAATRVCFRLGDVDAKRFASGFSYFDASDLENLKTGEAIVRMEQPTGDFNLSTVALEEIPQDEREKKLKNIVAYTRLHYGTPKEDVAKSLDHLNVTPNEAEEEKPKLEKKEPIVSAPKEIPPMPQPAPPQMDMLQEVRAKKAETQHRYWQMFIKRMAESRGYTAIIEDGIPDGSGRVDVSLEKDGKRIACEVSVTTTKAWEAHNAEKCLAAGYDEVIVCSNDDKHLAGIREEIQKKLPADMLAKIHVIETDAIAKYFDAEKLQATPMEKVVKGYKVKVTYE